MLPPALREYFIKLAHADFFHVLILFWQAAGAEQRVKDNQVVTIVAVGMAYVGTVMPAM